MEENQKCNTCAWSQFDHESEEFTCACEEAELYGLETEYNHVCEDYKER